MTASTVKSAKLTAQLITDPRTRSKEASDGGNVKIYAATHEAATTSIDETGDIIMMLALPSNAVPHSIRLFTDDLDSHSTPTLAYDVGLYNGPDAFTVPVSATNTAFAAFAVIDADAFASATTTGQSADVTGAEVRHEAADIANFDKTLWELAGMDRDPNKEFVVALTITTTAATPVAGTITVKVLASRG